MAPKSKLSDRFPTGDVFFGTSPDLPRIIELDVAKIVWNPDQPRKSIDPERLQELAASIAASGLIHPITVKRSGDDLYMIVVGERRLRAFGLLARTTIPAIISDGDADELALIENIQREDLSPIDEYQAVARLMEKHGYSQGDAALALGKSRVSINEIMSLGGLAASIRDEAQVAGASKSVLIEISRAEDAATQLELWAAVRDGANTVRALRANKNASAKGGEGSSPIDKALRAGRRFASAIAAIPETDRTRLGEIDIVVERLLALLDAHTRGSEDRF
jgi:ParB family chromosome partitioning protein